MSPLVLAPVFLAFSMATALACGPPPTGPSLPGGGEPPLGSNGVPMEVLPTPPGQPTPLEQYTAKYQAIAQANPSDFMARLRLAIALHHLGVLEQEGKVDEAYALLEQLHEEQPENPEVLVFLGSAMTLVARDSWNPFTKLSKVKEGAALIDRAVGLAPRNLTIRSARANNSLALPGFLGRRHFALEDYREMVRLFESGEGEAGIPQDPEFGVKAEDSLRFYAAQAYYKVGMLLLEQDQVEEGRRSLETATKILPGTAWSLAAELALKKMKQSP